MAAQKSDTNSTDKKKFVIGANLHQRLSKEDRDILLNLKPSKKKHELVEKLPSLKLLMGLHVVFSLITPSDSLLTLQRNLIVSGTICSGVMSGASQFIGYKMLTDVVGLKPQIFSNSLSLQMIMNANMSGRFKNRL